MESNRLVKETNQIIYWQETTFWHFENQHNVRVSVNRASFTHKVQTIPVHTCSQGQKIVAMCSHM